MELGTTGNRRKGKGGRERGWRRNGRDGSEEKGGKIRTRNERRK